MGTCQKTLQRHPVISSTRERVDCCDLSLNDPHTTDIANCIKARYDAGISNFKQDGTGVVRWK